MLRWDVYIGNFNRKQIEVHNVFNHPRFLEDCRETSKQCGDDFEWFSDGIRRNLLCYYWSKCEWETVLTLWPMTKDDFGKKISVFDQVNLNWDRFIEYVWNHRKELAS